jgi:hypothetical protein
MGRPLRRQNGNRLIAHCVQRLKKAALGKGAG